MASGQANRLTKKYDRLYTGLPVITDCNAPKDHRHKVAVRAERGAGCSVGFRPGSPPAPLSAPEDIIIPGYPTKKTTMKDLFMHRLRRGGVVVLITAVLLASTIAAHAQEAKFDEEWHFTIVPYLWLPSVNGKMNVSLPQGSSSDDFKICSSDYFSNLTFAAMLSMELEKGRWSLVSDITAKLVTASASSSQHRSSTATCSTTSTTTNF